MTKFHNRGGSYTFEEMEADAAARKAKSAKPAAPAKTEAPKAEQSAKADTPAPFGKPPA